MDASKNTTVKVKQDTRSELIRIKGRLEAERGEKVTYDDALRELIRFWKEAKQHQF